MVVVTVRPQISLVSAMAPTAYTHHTTGMLRLLAPLLAQVRDMTWDGVT